MTDCGCARSASGRDRNELISLRDEIKRLEHIGQKCRPFTATVIEGSANTLSAPTPQAFSGGTYDFQSWSDGGVGTHGITAAAAGTYTATYARR